MKTLLPSKLAKKAPVVKKASDAAISRVCRVCSVTLALAEQGHQIDDGVIHDACRSNLIREALSLTGEELKEYVSMAGQGPKLAFLAKGMCSDSMRIVSRFITDASSRSRVLRGASGPLNWMGAEGLANLLDGSITFFHLAHSEKYMPKERAILRKIQHLATGLKKGWVEIVVLS